jgi:sugar phosphate isomerase/epimerase
MKLGISSFTFGWAVGMKVHGPSSRLNEVGLLEKARVLGVNLLQIGDNLPLHTFDPRRLSNLASSAAKQGIQLEIGARGLTPDRVMTYVRIARTVGAHLIRFVIDDANYNPAPENVTSILREVAPSLEGLTLGIENHDRFPAATLRNIIEKAGSDRIGVCLDTANSLGTGEGIETVAAVLAPLTVNLHIKDFAVQRVASLMGFNVIGRPAGQGLLNLPSLLKQLSGFQHCQTAVLELWTPPEVNLERTVAKEASWATQSLDYLKPLFANSLI